MRFSEGYKDEVFLIWYRLGKPGASDLYDAISSNKDDEKPTVDTLRTWVSGWKERAYSLDLQVQEEMESRLVKEKVEMLQRHTEIAEKMQSLAVDKIEEKLHDENWMTSATAVRMLVEGLRVERESRGIPSMLEKMSRWSDEQLLEEIKGLLEKGDVDREIIDGEFS